MGRQFRSETGRFVKGHVPKNKGCSDCEGKCKGCGKKFIYNKNKSFGVFCSKECYRVWRTKPGFRIKNAHRFKKGAIAWNKGNGIEKKCVECGALFKVCPSRRKTALYCSKQCQGKNEQFRKETSARQQGVPLDEWKSPTTPQNRLERNRFAQTIHKTVLERDNYTCQMCGKNRCHLHVDHIQSWAKYVELRFNINNCRTLYQGCHYKITFGREFSKEAKMWGTNSRRRLE